MLSEAETSPIPPPQAHGAAVPTPRAHLLAIIRDALANPGDFEARRARYRMIETLDLEGSATLIADAFLVPISPSGDRSFHEQLGTWLLTIIATGAAPDDIADLVADATEAHRIRTQRRAASDARHAAAQAALKIVHPEPVVGSRFD